MGKRVWCRTEEDRERARLRAGEPTAFLAVLLAVLLFVSPYPLPAV